MAKLNLDPDNISVTITCTKCRSGLWDMKILKRQGDQVVSTQYLPINPSIRQFSERNFDCPVCHQEFFGRNEDGEHMYRVIDHKTGAAGYI